VKGRWRRHGRLKTPATLITDHAHDLTHVGFQRNGFFTLELVVGDNEQHISAFRLISFSSFKRNFSSFEFAIWDSYRKRRSATLSSRSTRVDK